jgi:hypothetical protein
MHSSTHNDLVQPEQPGSPSYNHSLMGQNDEPSFSDIQPSPLGQPQGEQTPLEQTHHLRPSPIPQQASRNTSTPLSMPTSSGGVGAQFTQPTTLKQEDQLPLQSSVTGHNKNVVDVMEISEQDATEELSKQDHSYSYHNDTTSNHDEAQKQDLEESVSTTTNHSSSTDQTSKLESVASNDCDESVGSAKDEITVDPKQLSSAETSRCTSPASMTDENVRLLLRKLHEKGRLEKLVKEVQEAPAKKIGASSLVGESEKHPCSHEGCGKKFNRMCELRYWQPHLASY